MDQKYKKIIYIGLLVFLISLHISTIVLAAESTHIIGDDPEKDLRTFDGEWLVEEFEDTDWDELDEDLNTVYKHLDDNWDNRKACNPLYDNTQDTQYYNPENLRKYSKYDYVDILQVRAEDLDESNAKMVVQVAGDAEDADRPWFLFLWSDCAGDKDNLIFIGIFIPDLGIEGSGYSEYAYEYGDEDGNGTIDIEDDGHNIEMEFDADIWDDVKDCHIRAIMLTTKHDEFPFPEDEDMIIDIFPGSQQQLDMFWWLWILILIIAIIIALLVIYYLLKRRKAKKGMAKTAPRLKAKQE